MQITEFKSEGGTEYTVTNGNYQIRQLVRKNGEKHVEAMRNAGEYWQFISPFDDEVKPLFIALHNHKNGL